jgi:hypothetical protein
VRIYTGEGIARGPSGAAPPGQRPHPAHFDQDAGTRPGGASISAAVVSFCRPTMSNLVAWMEEVRGAFNRCELRSRLPLSAQQRGATRSKPSPMPFCRRPKSDFRYNSQGFAYATSSSATGEPPCNESSNARYRYFPRTPFFVAFELAGCQQLVAPRVAACEHLPRDLRFDDKRLEVTSFRTAI